MPLVEQMQIMHDVLDIDTIFDVDTAHIYISQIFMHIPSDMQEYFS